ncbi:MAG: hypothetical protein E7279_02910 [Lachnospiraceae bacterium]|nr:hypothetical protein [Lachnospiraceae bacterium]
MGKSYKVINEEKGIGISYIPKKSNGVAIIMREPGGDDGSLEGNNDWFIKMLDEKNMSTYRNRFLEMVKTASNEPNKVGFNDLKDIYFANIMYNSCGSSLSENYKNLGEEEKENRINLIIDEILKDSKKKGVDLKKVFIIKDGFDALTKKEKGLLDDGIEYKIKYKKFSKDGIDYYAVRHPVGSPHISYEK